MEQLSLDFAVSFGATPAQTVSPGSTSGVAVAHLPKGRVMGAVSPVPAGVGASAVQQQPRTLADVLAAVTAASRLTASRRRDLVSAVRSLGRLCRLPLTSISARPSDLRALGDHLFRDN